MPDETTPAYPRPLQIGPALIGAGDRVYVVA